MRIAASVFVLAFVAFPTVLATVHTECFNYFLQKDGCVWGAADNKRRCDKNGKPPQMPVGLIEPPQQHSKRSQESLQRRYDTVGDNTVFPVAGGTGACGPYDTNAPGACLWVGSEQRDDHITVATAGWLNGLKTSNCHKQIYIMRANQPQSVLYVPVIDGCLLYTTQVDVGCFQIAVTNRTFHDLNPSPDEIASSHIFGKVTWDFDNYDGSKPSNGPV